MTAQHHTTLAGLSHVQRRALLHHLRTTGAGARRPSAESDTSPEPATDVRPADVVVLGGGVAGLTFALQVKRSRPSTDVVVVERSSFPVRETTHKVGESTVEIAAHYLRDELGLGDHLEREQIRKFGLRMFFTDGSNRDIGTRREVGSSVFPPLATYQLDRGRLENELALRCREAGVVLLTGRVDTVALGPGADDHVVHVEGQDPLRARWVVDATGRGRLLHRTAGRRPVPNDHDANAVWFRLDHPIDVSTWTRDAAWHARIKEGERWKSTVHLMGEGYWVWLIRLPSGATSVGIVAAADQHDFSQFNNLSKALSWLRSREPQCAEVVDRHRDRVLDFRVMRNYSYTCGQVFDGRARWIVAGEAGLFLDPLYSPGLDQVAIANSLGCDLVTRSLDGEDVAAAAAVHDRLYLRIAQIWLEVYRGQYGLLGNAPVMTAKVIWDTAFYWGVFGFLFFHGRFLQLATDPDVVAELERLAILSTRVQSLFREWAELGPAGPTPDFVDLYGPLEFMVDLHHSMLADCDVARQLTKNRELLEQLAGQLADALLHQHSDDTRDTTVATVQAWQRDRLLTELRRFHRSRRTSTPTSAGWIRPSLPDQTRGEFRDVGAA